MTHPGSVRVGSRSPFLPPDLRDGDVIVVIVAVLLVGRVLARHHERVVLVVRSPLLHHLDRLGSKRSRRLPPRDLALSSTAAGDRAGKRTVRRSSRSLAGLRVRRFSSSLVLGFRRLALRGESTSDALLSRLVCHVGILLLAVRRCLSSRTLLVARVQVLLLFLLFSSSRSTLPRSAGTPHLSRGRDDGGPGLGALVLDVLVEVDRVAVSPNVAAGALEPFRSSVSSDSEV